MKGTVHVAGAGLAGLAAAVRLAGAGRRVVVHEATGHAGGRCRSYREQALGMTIDNGNHLLLSGNAAAMAYLRAIGAEDRLFGPDSASFAFADLASGERWKLDLGSGRWPWWLADRRRRVPGTRLGEYLRAARLMLGSDEGKLRDRLPCSGPLYERLLGPLLTAALNTDPPVASAALARTLLRSTLGAGGMACRPLIARDGLSHAFVEPALAFIAAHGGEVGFQRPLRGLETATDRVAGLALSGAAVPLGPDDAVILAVPPTVAAGLVPGLAVPTEYRAIVNAHFRVEADPGLPPILGVINGTLEWLFSYPGRLSVTVSNADRLTEEPREPLAARIWREIETLAPAVAGPMPAWQIVRERRATFAALPEQEPLRPATRTRWRNLFMAGDWTATGLPATIEGAIRSGHRAADLASGRKSSTE